MRKISILLLALMFYAPVYAQVAPDQATLTQQLVVALQQTINLLIEQVHNLELQLGQALAKQQVQDVAIQNIQTTQQTQSNQIQQVVNRVAPTTQAPVTTNVAPATSQAISTPVTIQPTRLVVDTYCGEVWSRQGKPCDDTVTIGTTTLNSILYRPYLLDKDGEFQADFTSIPITVTFPETDKVKTEYVKGAYPGIDGNQYIYTPVNTGNQTITFSASGFTVTKNLRIK